MYLDYVKLLRARLFNRRKLESLSSKPIQGLQIFGEVHGNVVKALNVGLFLIVVLGKMLDFGLIFGLVTFL